MTPVANDPDVKGEAAGSGDVKPVSAGVAGDVKPAAFARGRVPPAYLEPVRSPKPVCLKPNVAGLCGRAPPAYLEPVRSREACVLLNPM